MRDDRLKNIAVQSESNTIEKRIKISPKVWEPAWLVMIADVDAASVITAVEPSAVYGTKLIWFLLLLAAPFYQVSATAEKGIKVKNLKAVRFETAVGAVVSELIMIAIATIGVNKDSLNFTSPGVMGQYYLKGFNKFIYWTFFVLILGTGTISIYLLL